jgi:hypothetical protein
VVAVLLVLISAGGLVSTGGSPPTGPQPFGFVLDETGSHNGTAGHVYNISSVWINNESFTLSWVQFNVLALNAAQVVNITVDVSDESGAVIALYNSSDSSYRGAYSGLQVPLDSYGGWVSGGSTNFSSTDVFHVTSLVSLSGRDLYFGMQLMTTPHYAEVQALPL